MALGLWLAGQSLRADGRLPGPTGDRRVTGQATQPAGSVDRLKGMAYGPYREGENPDWEPFPTLAEVQQDMPLLDLVANGVRTYGCQNLETVLTATQEIDLIRGCLRPHSAVCYRRNGLAFLQANSCSSVVAGRARNAYHRGLRSRRYAIA